MWIKNSFPGFPFTSLCLFFVLKIIFFYVRERETIWCRCRALSIDEPVALPCPRPLACLTIFFNGFKRISCNDMAQIRNLFLRSLKQVDFLLLLPYSLLSLRSFLIDLVVPLNYFQRLCMWVNRSQTENFFLYYCWWLPVDNTKKTPFFYYWSYWLFFGVIWQYFFGFILFVFCFYWQAMMINKIF